MSERLESLWHDLFEIALFPDGLELFKSKLNREVIFYDSLYNGYILNSLVWCEKSDYAKAVLDSIQSHEERMRMFSTKSAPPSLCVLQMAVQNNDIKTVKFLLEYGADPCIEGFDVLVRSIYKCSIEMTRLLLRHGARFHYKYSEQDIPIILLDAIRIVKSIKAVETIISPLVIRRLHQGVYLNKEILQELLHYLI